MLRASVSDIKLVSTDGGIIGGVAHDPSACRQGQGRKKYKLSPTTSVPSRQSFAATRLEEAGAS